MKINKQKLQIIPVYIMIFFIGTTLSTVGFYLKFRKVKPIKEDKKTIQITKSDLNKDEVKKKDLSKYDNITVLVNKNQELPNEYIPNDLRTVNIEFCFKGDDEQKRMRNEAATNLEQLIKDSKEKGIKLIGVSAYRSYETQDNFYKNSVEKQGSVHAEKFSAKPGMSEHQTGLSIDLTCKSVNNKLVEQFANTKEGMWLKENSNRYGFIIRYPKDKVDITGYAYEPWHIRYVGKSLAEYLKNNKLTLEEYKKNDEKSDKKIYKGMELEK